MDVRLILRNGRQEGRETPLARGVYLVGRSKTCQIRPKNRYVSRKHCAFIHKRQSLLIQDLGSRTGTYVNGERIEPSVALPLKDGDRIRVGKTRFAISIRQSDEIQLATNSLAAPRSESHHELTDSGVSDSENVAAEPMAPNAIRGIEDVLELLEENDANDAESPSDVLDSMPEEIQVEEEDSDEQVDFAVPKSSDSLVENSAVPSYALRQDWDVNGVYAWVSKKEAYAKQSERRARRNARATERAGESEEANQPPFTTTTNRRVPPTSSSAPNTDWSAWLESDSVRPIVLTVSAILFLAWIAYNAWLLISFKG